MIQVDNLSYSLPEKVLYKNASFTIEDRRHCALIGSNGCGKTTLIDLMLHRDDYICSGKVKLSDVNRVSYVNQFVVHQKDRSISVYDYLCEDFVQMQAEMDRLCEELETAEDSDAAMELYQQKLDEFMAIDGYDHEVNILKQLKAAGLEALRDTDLCVISGGEYKLIQILRQMLRLPDLLIMDEPDVFLDFENLNSLRILINSYPGTILAATHNRYLLNNCFDKILQIENSEIQEYDGSYIDFCLTQLQMKIAMQELSKKEADFISYEEAVVERMRDDATKHDSLKKGKTLHARVSYIERWKARHIKEPYIESRMPDIRLPDIDEELDPSENAISVENYSVSFSKPLLENVSFELKPGDKAALVGANGTGKTTLLRDIWHADKDSITVSDALRTSFLSQFHSETLDESLTIWEYMQTLGFEVRAQAEEYLEAYCFDEDVLDRRICHLSGGEKNLLQLAGISTTDSSLLLLDEPTSHLDLRAQIALENAVLNYKGTVLMVSHDFYTIANCMDYVLFAENNTIRKMSLRAFRKMIYKRHFPADYLELEQRKKELEIQINTALKASDYELAKSICVKLEDVVSMMQN